MKKLLKVLPVLAAHRFQNLLFIKRVHRDLVEPQTLRAPLRQRQHGRGNRILELNLSRNRRIELIFHPFLFQILQRAVGIIQLFMMKDLVYNAADLLLIFTGQRSSLHLFQQAFYQKRIERTAFSVLDHLQGRLV